MSGAVENYRIGETMGPIFISDKSAEALSREMHGSTGTLS
jgi:hypothetical protein